MDQALIAIGTWTFQSVLYFDLLNFYENCVHVMLRKTAMLGIILAWADIHQIVWTCSPKISMKSVPYKMTHQQRLPSVNQNLSNSYFLFARVKFRERLQKLSNKNPIWFLLSKMMIKSNHYFEC